MKYSLVFFALVVVAAVNVSALPADAIKPSSEMDDLNNPEKHVIPVVSNGPADEMPDPLLPPNRPEAPCENAVCAGCWDNPKKYSACVERCGKWAWSTGPGAFPRGC